MYGLQPQVQLDLRAFLNANKRRTKVTWCGYMFLQCPHGSRAAAEILDIDGQGRTSITFDENSCRTYDRHTILARSPKRTQTDGAARHLTYSGPGASRLEVPE